MSEIDEIAVTPFEENPNAEVATINPADSDTLQTESASAVDEPKVTSTSNTSGVSDDKLTELKEDPVLIADAKANNQSVAQHVKEVDGLTSNNVSTEDLLEDSNLVELKRDIPRIDRVVANKAVSKDSQLYKNSLAFLRETESTESADKTAAKVEAGDIRGTEINDYAANAAVINALAIKGVKKDPDFPVETLLGDYELDTKWSITAIEYTVHSLSKLGEFRAVAALLDKHPSTMLDTSRLRVCYNLLANYKQPTISTRGGLKKEGTAFYQTLEYIHTEWQHMERNDIRVINQAVWIGASKDARNVLIEVNEDTERLITIGAIVQEKLQMRNEYISDIIQRTLNLRIEALKDD